MFLILLQVYSFVIHLNVYNCVRYWKPIRHVDAKSLIDNLWPNREKHRKNNNR